MITGYEVKPCPRCGAGQEHLHLRTEPPYMVRCGHCGLCVRCAGLDEAEAVAAWNSTTRTAEAGAPGATATEIAGEMIATIVHDSDLLDMAREKVAHVRAKLAEKLAEPLCKEGAALFTKEFIEDFCIGEDTDVQSILAAHPSLQPVHDMLNEFFEGA